MERLSQFPGFGCHSARQSAESIVACFFTRLPAGLVTLEIGDKLRNPSPRLSRARSQTVGTQPERRAAWMDGSIDGYNLSGRSSLNGKGVGNRSPGQFDLPIVCLSGSRLLEPGRILCIGFKMFDIRGEESSTHVHFSRPAPKNVRIPHLHRPF